MTHATMSQEPELELIVERASAERRRTSLLFVHGINVGAWIWRDHYLPYFAAAGFDSYAVSLRGHGDSDGRDRIHAWTLGDYVRDLAVAAGRIDGPVVIVGHSMGGAVVQRFIREGGRADGMALLASVPPWGMGPSTLGTSMTAPWLLPKLAALLSGDRPQVDLAMLREILVSPDAPRETLERITRQAGPESPWIALGIQGLPPIAPLPWQAPPAFVLGAGRDRLIPVQQAVLTGLYYGCPAEIVPTLAHAVMVEPRWQDGAERLGTWLARTFA